MAHPVPPPPSVPSRSSSTAAAAGAIALWCWTGISFRLGAQNIGVMPFLAISLIFGVLAGMVMQRLTGRRVADLFRLPLRVFLAGLAGVTVQTLCLVWAIHLAGPIELGQVTLINYLWPVLLVVLGLCFLPDKPRPSIALCGALLGLAGVVLAGGPQSLATPPASYLPHGLAFSAAFLWALYCVLLKRWQVPEEQSGAIFQFLILAVVCALGATMTGQWRQAPPFTAQEYFWIPFCGIGPMGLAYFWWEIGVKRGATHLVAVLANFIPVGSALIIALLLDATLNPGLLPGALLIAAGAGISRRAMGGRRPESAPQEEAPQTFATVDE